MSLYLESSKIISRVNYGGLRAAVYSDKSIKSRPEQLYALCVETLKHQEILSEVIENSRLLELERKVKPPVEWGRLLSQLTHPLALVLLHDFFLAKGGIATSDGPLKSSILRNKARLSAEFTRTRLKRGYATKAAFISHHENRVPRFPRWVRTNNLKSSLEDLMAGPFSQFIPVDDLKQLYPVGDGRPNKVYVEPFVDNLLAFAPAAPLLKHPLTRTGAIVFQDRASCVPAQLLNPPPDAYIIDATAAPGNKTTQLASMLGRDSHGKIFAFERDVRRSTTLESTVCAAGASGLVEIRAHQDFMKSDPWRLDEVDRIAKATHIMVDPTCSGSGIVERTEYQYVPTTADTAHKRQRYNKDDPALPSKKPASAVEYSDGLSMSMVDNERLLHLSGFQKRIIQHAMRFPRATRITYSTCSVYEQENEHVVMAVLNSPIARNRGWKVEPRHMNRLKDWKKRGRVEECDGDKEVADACIRFDPWVDGGVGFFVVVFVKSGEAVESATPPVLGSSGSGGIGQMDTGADKEGRSRGTDGGGSFEVPPGRKAFPQPGHASFIRYYPAVGQGSELSLPPPPLVAHTEAQRGTITQVIRRSTETSPRVRKLYHDLNGQILNHETDNTVTMTGAAGLPVTKPSVKVDGPNIVWGGAKPKKLTKREKQREKQQRREKELALIRPIKVREREIRDGSYAEVFDDDIEYVVSRAKSVVKRQASEGNLERLRPVRISVEDFERRDFSNLGFSAKRGI